MIPARGLFLEEVMGFCGRVRRLVLCLVVLSFMIAAAPAEAQREFEPLFDKFNVKGEFSWLALSTEIRLDSEVLGEGTTLSFEDDLNLDGNKAIPTLAFEWQIAKRHRLGVRWQNIDRDSTAQALTEIRFGDEVIPIDADITLGFDLDQYYIDYAFYPWVKDRWAAGFGLGLRWVDVTMSLQWQLEADDPLGGTEAAGVSAPLPYLYFEYRRLLSDHWRMVLGAGWLEVTIEDISGGQYIGRASFEYLLGKRWAFGAAINLATIDVDWEGIETDEGNLVKADMKIDTNDVSIFARVRF
jgi:hypothetical protein